MIKNYIKTAWRNLLKNKFYSLINIAGLTVGLAVGILILLWVQDELSFDKFHKNADNIYRVELFGGTGPSRQIFTNAVPAIGPMAKQQLPGVIAQVRVTDNYDYSLFTYKEKNISDERAVYADPSFFTVFDFNIIKGNPAKPFADDNSVVITKETAQKFFGDADPIGKVIVADNKTSLTVTGVVNNFPKNTAFAVDMLMPMSANFKKMLASNHLDMNNNFSWLSYATFLLLKPGTPLKALATQLTSIHVKHSPADTDADYLLLPLTKMHLFNADMTDRGMQTVRIFTIIALFILLIACINYVNLSTARSMLRAKEISMRKIIGASKTNLFLQFIIETTLVFFIAATAAVGLCYLLMPVFNYISGKELSLNLSDYHVLLVILLATLGTLAASSIYPALLLSSFEPLKALKGKISAGIGDVLFRKILVVTQFTFSVILIIGTIVITGQLKYIRSKALGYDKSHVFSVWMRDMDKHYDAVKAELLKQPGIVGVSRSSQNIVNLGSSTGDIDWDGKDAKQNTWVRQMAIDKDLIPFFKIKLMAGANFTGAVNDSAHFILNEAAVKEAGFKDPVGKRFRLHQTKGTIIGVVKDFHYTSMKEKIAPAVFYYNVNYLNKMYVRTNGDEAQKAIAAVQTQFKQYNGEYPFGYAFLDETFDSLYRTEQREGTLFNYFSSIAILISCLGLLGLTAYTVQVRTREIGVRKVLGASIGSIIGLLANDFIRLVGIAIVIASPVAWYFMNNWLQGFAYKTPIGWQVFVYAGIGSILIAFITISFQSVKAALANPVKSLRSE